MKTYIYIFFALLLTQTSFGKNEIQFDPQPLDFGNILPGSTISLPVKVINKSTKGIVFQRYKFDDNFENSLSVKISLPFEVPKPGTAEKQLIFTVVAPMDYLGEVNTEFYLFSEDLLDSVELYLKYNVKKEDNLPSSADLSIPALSYRIGDTFRIPINIDRFEGEVLPTKFRALVSFNTSLCAFNNFSDIGTVEYGIQTKELEGQIVKKPEHNDVFYFPKMIATLGDAKSTDIKLLDFIWLNNSNEKLNVKNSFINGQLSIQDISYEKPRLVTALSENLEITPVINSNNSDIILQIKYKGKAKLEIFNVLGIPAFDATNMLPHHSAISTDQITIPRNSLNNVGTYIVRLSNAFEFVSEIVIVK